jgi:hypothetical protein
VNMLSHECHLQSNNPVRNASLLSACCQVDRSAVHVTRVFDAIGPKMLVDAGDGDECDDEHLLLYRRKSLN